jgi:hypothetical protein
MTTAATQSHSDRVRAGLERLKKTRKGMVVDQVMESQDEVVAFLRFHRKVVQMLVSKDSVARQTELTLPVLLDEIIKGLLGKQNKFGAMKVKEDGYTFDSMAEWRQYLKLRQMQQDGEISDLRVHPSFTLRERMQLVLRDGKRELLSALHHRPDFGFTEGGRKIVLEVKGVRTQDWKTRYNLFRREFPDIEYRIVEAKRV